MKKIYKTVLFVAVSLLLLGIYLYADSNHGSLHNQILSTDILSYEQIEQLSAGKKDAFMQLIQLCYRSPPEIVVSLNQYLFPGKTRYPC